MGKIVQHRENILNPSREKLRGVKSSNTIGKTYIKLTALTTAPCWYCRKITFSLKKSGQLSF